MPARAHHDVVILGAGLAGLSLARHLLLTTDKSVLLVDRRPQVPGPRQKVGESTVQLAGYYFSKVLELEEYLLHDQLMKYNLRFYWPTAGRDNRGFEDFGQSYIRAFSNIASYQLDRNTFEAELLRRNLADERCAFSGGIGDLEVALTEEGEAPHSVRFRTGDRQHELTADWVVDTTGRGRLLAKRRQLTRDNPIRHGALFLWVDGLVDIEALTDLCPTERRLHPSRRQTGHLPYWLATNHFMGEGLWFWVIPLRGKTSLGLVFDHRVADFDKLAKPEKLIEWICERFPLFARDLPQREVVDFSGYKDFSHGCLTTLSPQRWAMSGEAGRFLDPLYSPGSDFIAIHNTLIVDAIAGSQQPDELASRCRLSEQLLRAVYEAYMPGFSVSYDALGDQELFMLKYGWELAVYFGFYVFPFINDLLTDRRFLVGYLNRFGRLGPINRGLQQLLSDYFQWKREHVEPRREPAYGDFTDLGPLAAAADTFYQVGLDAGEARRVLDEQVDSLRELARFGAAWVASVVVDDPALVTNRAYVEAIEPAELSFDPEAMRRRWSECAGRPERWRWSFDPGVMERFRGELTAAGRAGLAEMEMATAGPAMVEGAA